MSHQLIVMCTMTLQMAIGLAPPHPKKAPSKRLPIANVEKLVHRIQTFYDKTQDFTAEFHQVYTYAPFKRVSQSIGKVTYKKPALMRWEYKTQDGKKSPRTFILNGKHASMYDPQAKLLTRTTILTTQLSAAISFLWGQGKLIDEFSIAAAPCDSCIGILLRLKPLGVKSRFKELKLEVDRKTAQVLRSIVIDHDGSENSISFLNTKTNTGVDEDFFKLSIPPDIQVQDFVPKQ